MSSEQCDKATDCCSHSIFIRNGWKAGKRTTYDDRSYTTCYVGTRDPNPGLYDCMERSLQIKSSPMSYICLLRSVLIPIEL